MKKMIVTIIILLVIFIGMVIYRNTANTGNGVNISEIDEIENYIQQIYMWKEITNEALPCFENINNANEIWIWEVVRKNIDGGEFEYSQIEEKSHEIFGSEFSKNFPQSGTKYLVYNEQENKYITTGINIDAKKDSFLLNKISKKENQYSVEIVEYLEDYTQAQEENTEVQIPIQNLQGEEIFYANSSEDESKIKETVKENIDKFSKKKITLEKSENNSIYVKKVEQM